jgi:muramoyltetrapeptide carboxypeptidase LdcA involved in peptidoglycan recycling
MNTFMHDIEELKKEIWFLKNKTIKNLIEEVALLTGGQLDSTLMGRITTLEENLSALENSVKTLNADLETNNEATINFGTQVVDLSVLYSLLGSESFGETTNKILFLEDLDEYLYHIDRMMQALKRAGKLSNLKALVVGSFSQMHDNTIPFGQTAYEIIASCVEEYNYPKVFGVNIGHEKRKNIPIVIGKNTRIQIKNNIISIEQL